MEVGARSQSRLMQCARQGSPRQSRPPPRLAAQALRSPRRPHQRRSSNPVFLGRVQRHRPSRAHRRSASLWSIDPTAGESLPSPVVKRSRDSGFAAGRPAVAMLFSSSGVTKTEDVHLVFEDHRQSCEAMWDFLVSLPRWPSSCPLLQPAPLEAAPRNPTDSHASCPDSRCQVRDRLHIR